MTDLSCYVPQSLRSPNPAGVISPDPAVRHRADGVATEAEKRLTRGRGQYGRRPAPDIHNARSTLRRLPHSVMSAGGSATGVVRSVTSPDRSPAEVARTVTAPADVVVCTKAIHRPSKACRSGAW